MTGEPITITLPAVAVTAAPPTLVSQHNVKATCGVEPRAYLRDLLPRFEADGHQVGRRGKLRFVDRVAFAAWLLEGERAAKPAAADPADALAASLGLTPTGGSR